MKDAIWPPPALQNEGEIDLFAQILKQENVRSYLEIGSMFGGSLWRIATSLPRGSRVVSVDLPFGTARWNESKDSLICCAKQLEELGYDIHLLFGDSTSPDIVNSVRRLGPFDAAFIDANHNFSFVNADWEHYGAMARIVAFHDISWKRIAPWNSKDLRTVLHRLKLELRRLRGNRIEVPQVWERLKSEFPHEELSAGEESNGIGVLWRDMTKLPALACNPEAVTKLARDDEPHRLGKLNIA